MTIIECLGDSIVTVTESVLMYVSVAKHRGIFEDRSAEIQALTYDIRQV